MEGLKKIKSVLISVFDKTGLEKLADTFHNFGITIYSTGGTFTFIENLGIPATKVEDVTSYPSILGGRVKTLHPKVFGGILGRRSLEEDMQQMQEYAIPEIDMVIVDLYPFEKTLATTRDETAIIEKIDIGGISLIRAAAKNFRDVLIVPSIEYYNEVIDILKTNNGAATAEQRKLFASRAFAVSSHYDTAIFNYFNANEKIVAFKESRQEHKVLRYGENPHQKGYYFGNLNESFEQLNGKEISYNNILDLDAGIHLIDEFSEPTLAILKHNNACGLASRPDLLTAWKDALAGDPVSAYGGVIVTNTPVDRQTAEEMNKLFFEIILAPSYQEGTLEILKSKKNRIILKQIHSAQTNYVFRSSLKGVLVQQKDLKTELAEDLNFVSTRQGTPDEISDLLFANKIVKHSKSNAIVLVKNKQLLASGVGQTSRVDALKQAIEKAGVFNFSLQGAVMASDAFFPFADSVEIAHQAGITAVIQPGGSIRDIDSIEYCNNNDLAMAFTGFRHFKH
ncbi:MAG: bifunctional phosphoribosylaminoimidazolecarboxamide formyltransferase/IMP cyclohydrolase [Bacteroidales bacterium]|nr:bifunctional phosphoribosylaminoimidazolecarboxamide formyltransferase/IMP cyclohydrolase [Bacteroidales bacterium]